MTVRWKPLLVLSGLFLVIAVLGVIAMVYALVPRSSGDILPLARSERTAKHFDKALIHYRRALQKDGRNPAIHEEMAAMYAEWAEQAPAEKKAEVQYGRIESLIQAAKFGKSLKEPRRQLLADAMRRDVSADAVVWAREVLTLEPNDANAHYVLAAEALEASAPNIPDVKRHLTALEAAKAPPVRIAWLKARLAQQTGDEAAKAEALTQSRSLTLPADSDPVDRMALLRLRALDVQTTTEPLQLAERVRALQAETKALRSGPSPAAARVTRLSLLLERVQKSLTLLASGAEPRARAGFEALVDSIEGDVEALFQKALDPANQPEIQVYLTYADHLRYRQKGAQCLEVVARGLKSPQASRPAAGEAVMGLHAVAVEAALADLGDASRFEKATPHLKTLMEGPFPRYKGFGHLFQGSIDLEQSGAAKISGPATGKQTAPSPAQLKLRASALNHLKLAADLLPDVAEAQARYGVALVLALEQSLGRQYLQNAIRLGNLDPKYQIWAAWSMVQAGYPEEAEPIVSELLAQVAQGRQPRDLESTLHLLNAEIHQARRDPEDLKQALGEYSKAIASGQKPTPAVQLRLAQIDVQLGHHDRALARIDALRKLGQGGPAAEHLAVLTLQEQGKVAEARAVLDRARKEYPQSNELVGLDAALLVKADKPREADRVLADYLATDPENVGIVLMRAELLADRLDNPDEARKLLVKIADRSDNSGPLVQLAMLDIRRHDFDAATATIAKIRARWKEAAVGDLLDAQLALDQGDMSAASAHFDSVLKKDPGNKLVQYWKAQLDNRNGATNDAKQALEAIARERPTKEVDAGLSLMDAAQSALAGIALQNGDVDGAIRRLEELRAKGQGQVGKLSRGDRWQLVTAYAAKGQWDAARGEMVSLLNDAKNPPSPDERVRAANLYRFHKEDGAAVAQLDNVLKVDPANPGAVVTRAYMLAGARKFEEAGSLLRKAIAAPQKAKIPAVFFLMLAAVDTLTPPANTASQRASKTLDRGLEVQPESAELVHAKYRVLKMLEGDKPALEFVEAKAKANPKFFRRKLVEIYRERRDFAKAQRVLETLLEENPRDSQAAANLVRTVSLQAVDASEHDDRNLERSLNEKAASLIRDFRSRFPNDLSFLQLDCDLAARRGDLARATAITQEMDKIAKNSPSGPLTRARIYAAQGRTREVAEAYAEALERNPRQLDVRLLLGQASLKLGETDEALRQAKLVLDVDRDQPDALLLEARALSSQSGSPDEVAFRRAQAVERLSDAIRQDPRFLDAYRLKSEILFSQGERAKGIAALKEELAAAPDDAAGLAQLVQHLCEPHDGHAASAAELAEARSIASKVEARDDRGNLMLALAIGFHKAGRLDDALPLAEKAAAKLDTPGVHLNYGHLLLAIAEQAHDAGSDQAKTFFRRAVEQYDLVLKSQANSIEAVNNKAWILHTYLGQSKAALDLATALLRRLDPATLPGEFFDTLGAIQEATGRARDAEDSYTKGLSKAPDHPILNYHMGRLIATDRARAPKAAGYLEKARAGRDRLTPAMTSDLESLIQKLARN